MFKLRTPNFALLIVSLVILALVTSPAVYAEEDDDWGDDWQDESAHSYSQQLAITYASILDSESINLNNQVLNELRYSFDYQYQDEVFQAVIELELLEDWLINRTKLETRDFNVSTSVGDSSDLKIGRQVITWGTGDLLFLNDLFAKDWQSFFSGREDKYLKSAIDAIRFSYFSEVNFEFALVPEFVADNVPNGTRLSLFVPGVGISQPNPTFRFEEPDKAEVAFRLFSSEGSLEWAVYGYKGFFKSPGKVLDNNKIGFSDMSSVGASLKFPALSGLINLEFAYYRSDDDKNGNDPLVDNSQIRFLLGFEKELRSNLTLATQVYLEKTLDYQALIPNVLPSQRTPQENRTMLTSRLTYLGLQQTLVNSLMAFYSPSDEDYYIRYSSRWSYSDNLKLALGLNLINGKEESTFLAQMQDNSNAFVRVNYLF